MPDILQDRVETCLSCGKIFSNDSTNFLPCRLMVTVFGKVLRKTSGTHCDQLSSLFLLTDEVQGNDPKTVSVSWL